MSKKGSIERKQLSVKVRADLVRKLDEAKWSLRMSKQDVVEKALDELFKKHNIK